MKYNAAIFKPTRYSNSSNPNRFPHELHDPKTVILVPGDDHSYRHCRAVVCTCLYDKSNGRINEDHGEDVTPEANYGKRLPAIIIN